MNPGDAILVRMHDKINRIRQLIASGETHVTDESLRDTIGDLGAYCLLYLARPENRRCP